MHTIWNDTVADTYGEAVRLIASAELAFMSMPNLFGVSDVNQKPEKQLEVDAINRAVATLEGKRCACGSLPDVRMRRGNPHVLIRPCDDCRHKARADAYNEQQARVKARRELQEAKAIDVEMQPHRRDEVIKNRMPPEAEQFFQALTIAGAVSGA